MKRSQWMSKLALMLALCGAVTASDTALAGNVTFVRRSTGNSHRVGKTVLIVNSTGEADSTVINEAVNANIPDGLPSVIAPLTANGEASLDGVDAYYTGELAGNYDHQNVIDHTGESEFTEVLELESSDFPLLGARCIHGAPGDQAKGNLDVSIDGDGIQFIHVAFEMDWQAAGILTGDSGFVGTSTFPAVSVSIDILRNGETVAQVYCSHYSFTMSESAAAWTQSGLSDGEEEYFSPTFLGDDSFGSLTLDDDFGFWAADDDIITYEVNVSYEHDANLSGWPSFIPGDAQFTANGLFNWRFALEDSHID